MDQATSTLIYPTLVCYVRLALDWRKSLLTKWKSWVKIFVKLNTNVESHFCCCSKNFT